MPFQTRFIDSSLSADDETKENSTPPPATTAAETPKAISNLLDLSLPSPIHASAAVSSDFVPLQPKDSSTNVGGAGGIDSTANANGDFGDFSGFQSAAAAAPPAPESGERLY